MMIDNQWINFVDVTLIAPIISVIFYNADRFSLLANKAYVFLGHISYSIYLNHWVVLWVASNFVAKHHNEAAGAHVHTIQTCEPHRDITPLGKQFRGDKRQRQRDHRHYDQCGSSGDVVRSAYRIVHAG